MQIGQPPSPAKRCPDCGVSKPLDDFPRNRSSADGRGGYCKPCHNERGRESRARLWGSSREYHLRRRYGISGEVAQELLERQQGACPICRERPPAHVDHDHDTGEIRGILCVGCNAGLGSFRDSVEWLLRAIDYLQNAPRHRPERDGKVADEKRRLGRPYRGVRESSVPYVLAAHPHHVR